MTCIIRNRPPEDGLPPREVRLTGLRAEPWPDNSHRIRVHVALTPFLERPDIEVVIAGTDGKKISGIDIIESIEDHLTFTMHLKGEQVSGQFTLHASITYPEIGLVDKKTVPFEVSEETT